MPLLSNNFRSGEISPRLDILKSAAVVQDGLLKARNVVINMQGGARKRPGLRLLTQLPTGKQWRRIFSWDKAETERLTVCYATDGEFKVMTEGGTLLDVTGRGNPNAEDDMQLQNQGVRAVFTDKREPKHIIGLPRNVGDDTILLTSETQAGALLRNFAAASGNYTPPADQPITLTNFANRAAALSVGELRMKFTPAAQSSSATSNFGVFSAAGFSNNPQTYKNPTTAIRVNEVWVQRSAGGNQNKMRVSLLTFPAWVEKVVVRWGTHSTEFTANNRFTDDALSSEALAAWIEARGDYSVEIVRRTDNYDTRNLSISIEAESTGNSYFGEVARVQGRIFNAPNLPDHGSLIHTGGTVGARPQVTSGRYPRNTNTAGNWRLRRLSDGRSVTGALSFTSDIISPGLIVGSASAMISAFGIDAPASEYVLELERGYARAGTATNITINGVNITDVSLALNENTLRVTQTGLTSGRRFVVVVGGQTIIFGAGQTAHNLNTAQRTAWAAALQFTIRAEPINVGLEANEADFYAMAVTIIDSESVPVYIRGRDFFRLNSARGLERLPLRDNRSVTALIVDNDFQRDTAAILTLYRERVLPVVNTGQYPAARLRELLTTSQFWAFRPSFKNPPVHLFTDSGEFNDEVERIGRRFCVQTGSSNSEYELEWVANVAVDDDGHQLTPVGGTKGSQSNRPALTRRGITDVFIDPANNNAVTTITGWRYSPQSGANANQVSDNPADQSMTDSQDQFRNSAIAAWGTLVARGIAAASANIGVAPGRYSMVWNDVDGYPAASVFTQGRLCFAGTRAFPSTIWMSFIRNSTNFLAQRPAAGDPKNSVIFQDYAMEVELESAAIQTMVNDAVLLIFTQNEAHIVSGTFVANNLAASNTQRFGRFGQQYNLGAPSIDEHIFTYSDGAAYGFWYESIDVGYQPKNISAIRNDDIFRNYKDAGLSSPFIDECNNLQPYKIPVASLADLTLAENTMTNSELRPVRIVSAQPEDLNGAFLVLFLMSDGTIRVWHTLHNQQFFAWTRWDFFGEENRVGTEQEVTGPNRRRIIDIAAQGSIVTLLDNTGRIYTLDGSQAFDHRDSNAAGATTDAIEVELETPSIAESRFIGEALLNPKSAKYAMLYFQTISGDTTIEVRGNSDVSRTVEFNPKISGGEEPLQPPNAEPKTVRGGRRYVELGVSYAGREDTEKVFSCVIKNTSKHAWELSRLDIQVEVDAPDGAAVRALSARGRV